MNKMVQKSTEEDIVAAPSSPPDDTDIVYPTGLKLALLMTSMFVGMFLVSLVCLVVSLML